MAAQSVKRVKTARLKKKKVQEITMHLYKVRLVLNTPSFINVQEFLSQQEHKFYKKIYT